MVIPKKALLKWKRLREHGDLVEMERKKIATQQTLIRIFETGRASQKVVEKMDQFYNKRQEYIKSLSK